MLGWWIRVYAQTPEQIEAATPEEGRAAVLAQWEAGLGGLRWIERLVESGRAQRLSAGGYPNRYIARAADLLPLLVNGPPSHEGPAMIGDDDVLPAHRRGTFERFADRIDAVSPEQVLTVEAWDQS